MDTSAPLRVGLVGVGRFGQLHAAVLSQLPGVELAAIADAIVESARSGQAVTLLLR